MWVNQIFGGIHWHRPVLRHPLCQLHDIKYYSSCDVNKFPVKSFPLIISVKFIILFETSKTTAASNSQFTNIGQNYAIYFLSIFSQISCKLFIIFLYPSSSWFRSIHFFHLFTILVWKYIYSLYLFHGDPIIILKFLSFHSTKQSSKKSFLNPPSSLLPRKFPQNHFIPRRGSLTIRDAPRADDQRKRVI